MGKSVSRKILPIVSPVAALFNLHDEQKDAKKEAEAAASRATAALAESEAEKEALEEEAEQQELVRKKYAALGRVSSGTAFRDGATTASTKVFS